MLVIFVSTLSLIPFNILAVNPYKQKANAIANYGKILAAQHNTKANPEWVKMLNTIFENSIYNNKPSFKQFTKKTADTLEIKEKIDTAFRKFDIDSNIVATTTDEESAAIINKLKKSIIIFFKIYSEILKSDVRQIKIFMSIIHEYRDGEISSNAFYSAACRHATALVWNRSEKENIHMKLNNASKLFNNLNLPPTKLVNDFREKYILATKQAEKSIPHIVNDVDFYNSIDFSSLLNLQKTSKEKIDKIFEKYENTMKYSIEQIDNAVQILTN